MWIASNTSPPMPTNHTGLYVMNKNNPRDNQITIYQAPDGKINIEVICANENIWLPQKRMAELFGCSVNISHCA